MNKPHDQKISIFHIADDLFLPGREEPGKND